MSDDRWADLRAALEAQSDEDDIHWRATPSDAEWLVCTATEGNIVCDTTPDGLEPVTASYIAAADPFTVGALLAERDALAHALERDGYNVDAILHRAAVGATGDEDQP